jgi:hypothetical protein
MFNTTVNFLTVRKVTDRHVEAVLLSYWAYMNIFTIVMATIQQLNCDDFFLSQVIVICLAVIHFLLVMFTEHVVVDYMLAKFIVPMWKTMTGLSTKGNKFLAVRKEMAAEGWPHVTRELPIKLNASVIELREPLHTVQIHMKASEETGSSFKNHEMADHAL